MHPLLLTADGGSTKADWLLQSNGKTIARRTTQGINPFMLQPCDIEHILHTELLCDPQFQNPNEVRFYGAGCRATGCCTMKNALHTVWPTADRVIVDTDLVGAATALFGNASGIACILGTGSNSALFIEGKMVHNVAPLGYILGDEGSGAALGKRLLGDILKRQLPEHLCHAFIKQYKLNADDIIERVYKQPLANRFLASFAPFLSEHRHEPSIQNLLLNEFTAFFWRNVATYQRPELPVSFVGSIAHYFSEELKQAAQKCGFKVERILQSPLNAL